MPFGYHLTSQNVATLIRDKGMLSMKARTGTEVAAPYGAFARNRDEKSPTMVKTKMVKNYLKLTFLGASKDDIKDCVKPDQPITGFTPKGLDPSDDLLELDRFDALALDAFKRAIPGISGKKLPDDKDRLFIKHWSSNRRKKATTQAVDAIMALKAHYLTRLAVQAVHFHYRIEELQTSTHVYFALDYAAVQNYDSYSKHLGRDNPLVVLRVNLGEVDHMPDTSQGDAVKIKGGVETKDLQIMREGIQFKVDVQREAAESWMPLADYGAKKSVERPRLH
ncbi:MAG: hypothetical protein AAF439_03605, partial [Pseudomonadota bacterium]